MAPTEYRISFAPETGRFCPLYTVPVTGGVVTGGVVTGGVVTGGVVTGGVVTGGVVTGGVVTGGVVVVPPVVGGGVVVGAVGVAGGVDVGEEPVGTDPPDNRDEPGIMPDPHPVRATPPAIQIRDKPILRRDLFERIPLLIKLVLSFKANKEKFSKPCKRSNTDRKRATHVLHAQGMEQKAIDSHTRRRR